MLSAYYNENDPYAAQWLRNLIAAGALARGDVDERSIGDVRAGDLAGYVQCHFFAGIGGWALALRLAGWPADRPVWTGSCPCQQLSSATRGRNTAADLWPTWFPLIAATRPREIFGEQVASRPAWMDRVCDDLESVDYEIGAAVLPACSIGRDHARARLYFAGHAHGNRKPSRAVNGKMAVLPRARGDAGTILRTHGLPSRMAQLRAFGNAIVPQVAAEFVAAYRECQP